MWGLVGDGVATLIASLMARHVIRHSDVEPQFAGGGRTSVIKPSIRERWDGRNELADLVQRISEDWCEVPCKG